jgi:hypothetical protein
MFTYFGPSLNLKEKELNLFINTKLPEFFHRLLRLKIKESN